MTDRENEKMINALRDMADYFRLCRKHAASKGTAARRFTIYVEAAEDAAELLKAQSEIVHCKDCEEFATKLNGETFCLRYDSYFGLQSPDDFCSHEKRRVDDDDADESDP